jgi:PAS domain S-box-containing protein
MKLQWKVFLLTFTISILIGGPLLWTVRESAHRILVDEVSQKGILAATQIVERLSDRFQGADEKALLPVLQAAQEQTGALYALASDASGRILAHTNVAEKGKIYSDAATKADLRAEKPHSHPAFYKQVQIMEITAPVWRLSEPALGEDFMLSGNKESTEKAYIGFVRIGLPVQHLLETEYRLMRRIVVIILIAGGLGILLFFFFMQRLLRPVQWLSAATARVSRGEYGASIPIQTRDELGDLARDFNRMSQALSETTVSKDYMSGILAGLIEPLIVMQLDTTIKQVNPALLTLLGYEASEVLGKSVDLLVPRKTRAFGETEEGMRMRGGAVRDMELELLTKAGGRIPVLYSSSLLQDTDQRVTGIVAVIKDMSERKKLETAIRQSEKMSAVGQLAAGVAHEINNPLGVILGFAQALVRRLQAGDTLEMPLKSIEKEAIRCKNLVQDLLTFSRASKAEREPVDINRAVEGALSLVMAQARMAHIEVKKELAPDLPRILGNQNQIQQIIINLSNNAMDAMVSNGVLTLRTEMATEGALSWVCLKILDTGPGIPAEIRARIFDPFFTTKPVGKGTGLGLSLVHEIIQKHSGTIDVESQPGKTVFVIKFPVRMAAAPATSSKAVS